MFDQISQKITQVFQEEYNLDDVHIQWETPQESAHGDIATPAALKNAKGAGANPREIAQKIVESLNGEEGIVRLEVAGPGYINIWLSADVMLQNAEESLAACSPVPTRKDEDPVIVEYSQPNVAKPLGVHHLISTLVGQAISNVYRHAGYNVVSWNYMGDWGTQFGKLSVAVQKWGDGRPTDQYSIDELLDLYVRFHNEVENDATLEDQARATFAALENGDEQIKAFWTDVVQTTKNSLSVIYDRLNVHFDTDVSESHYEGKMMPLIEEGKEKGVFKEGEKGALIAEFDEESNLQPAIVLKADGATIYHTRDLTSVRHRVEEYHPQSVLYVVDTAQENYFQQLFAIVRQLGWGLPHLEHVVIGRMRFSDKGMSTRKGNILRLGDFLNEAVQRASDVIANHGDSIQAEDSDDLAEMMGIGSVVYGVLSQNRRMNMTFDWEKFLSFDGNSAPYLQYTHARTRSVLRKAESEIPTRPPYSGELSELERGVLNALRQFPQVLEETREAHMPHMLTNYLFALCQSFNAFYNSETIAKAEGDKRSLRLYITYVTAEILKAGAQILTIRVPDRM